MTTFVSRALTAAALALGVTLTAAAQAQQVKPTLYKRIGGYDALAAVLDDFVPRLVTDPLVGKYFVGAGKDTQMHIRQMALDFFCNITGGPCLYIGRPMKTAHTGLGINEAEWDAGVRHFQATLDKFKVPQPEREELVAAVARLKTDIVEKK